MHLGIEQRSGTVFEGLNGPEIVASPRPFVSQCRLIEKPADWLHLPAGLDGISGATSWVFREDSFDPVTRVRRGRVYAPAAIAQPGPVNLSMATAHALGLGLQLDKPRSLMMYQYMAARQMLSMPRAGEGMALAIGTDAAASGWKIVQVEALVTSDVLVTLKAMSAFGLVPDLDLNRAPAAAIKPVRDALERALNSAFRETPVSVVDQCRNAIAVMLAHYLLAARHLDKVEGMELGPLSKLMADKAQKGVGANVASIVARLHSRGKGTGRPGPGAADRDVSEEDAEFAVHALGLVMREIGWAA